MKYSSSNKPLVCMQTQSTCYKGTNKMTPKGILWHGTGANNPYLKRYVQPSDVRPPEDTYSKEQWLQILGKNTNNNDWNHIVRQAGLNAWIGKLADGTVTAVQTMPWDYRPWGCGSGSKGSCNYGWMQFEICEDNLADKSYFEAAYREACELTAYYCKMYNIDPLGTVKYNGVVVPTILCHQDSYKLGLGSNHSDVYNWFNRYGKTMDDVRRDVAAIMNGGTTTVVTTKNIGVTYQIWDDVKNKWIPNVTGYDINDNSNGYAGNMGNAVCAIYANLSEGDCVYKVHTVKGEWLPEVKNRLDYAGNFNQPIDAFMIKSTNPDITITYQAHIQGGKWLEAVNGYSTTDAANGYAGVIGKAIDAIAICAVKKITTVVSIPVAQPTPAPAPTPVVEEKKYYRIRKSWADSKSQVGAYTSLENAIEKCQAVGEGYKVFDWDGKEVYSYKAPTPAPTPIPAPEVKIEPEIVPTPSEPAPQPEIKIEQEEEVVPEVTPEITPIEPQKPDTSEIEINVPTPETEKPEPDPLPKDPDIVQPTIEKETKDWVHIVIELCKKLIYAVVELFKNRR